MVLHNILLNKANSYISSSKSIVLHSCFLDRNTAGRSVMLVIMRRDSFFLFVIQNNSFYSRVKKKRRGF